MPSGRLIDYLGQGAIADRPATPDLHADTLGLWWATDTNVLSGWDGSTWTDVAGGGTGDFVGPASSVDGNLVVFDGTTGKLGKDGGTPLANPMTTAGDIITGGTSGAAQRLAAGTDTHVLTMVSGAPAWAASSGGSGAVDSVNGDTGAVIVAVPIIIACSDETTALTTGTAKATFRMPYAFTLTAVRASVTTAPTGSVLTVDINESGSSILSTKLTIDATEKTSTTAATPAVISDSALANDAEITIDIDGVGSTIAGAGLKVTLIGYAS